MAGRQLSILYLIRLVEPETVYQQASAKGLCIWQLVQQTSPTFKHRQMQYHKIS